MPRLSLSFRQNRPLVVGTLLGSAPVASQLRRARSASVDIVELRLDTFPSFSRQLIQDVKKKTKKPLLLTLRSYKECGVRLPKAKQLTDRRRAELLLPLVPLADLIDVEIRSGDFARTLTRLAHRKKKTVIHSYHDFASSGQWPAIDRMARQSVKWKGDIFKLAVKIKSEDQLIGFYSRCARLPVPMKALIGMGKEASVSRVLGYSFGSVLTYGHLGRTAAPGQWPVAVLMKQVRRLYGP